MADEITAKFRCQCYGRQRLLRWTSPQTAQGQAKAELAHRLLPVQPLPYFGVVGRVWKVKCSWRRKRRNKKKVGKKRGRERGRRFFNYIYKQEWTRYPWPSVLTKPYYISPDQDIGIKKHLLQGSFKSANLFTYISCYKYQGIGI